LGIAGAHELVTTSKNVNSESWSKNTLETKADPVTQHGRSRSFEVERIFKPEWLDVKHFKTESSFVGGIEL